jgi:hypothetical protein
LAQNLARKYALARARGYGVGAYLFVGFPDNVEWARAVLTHDDLGQLRYLNHQDWIAMSRGSRLVRDGAADVRAVPVEAYVTDKVERIEAQLLKGKRRACRSSSWQRIGMRLT